ncbi:phytanoyl-CoA dioxygenase family protein [Paralimibaculum aggregatum]|nr:phytanoyl-CoA dioxygenase family protein [Limibaculum sp. NKW23]
MAQLHREITKDEIRTYREDGIVVLRGFFNSDAVEMLRELAEEDMAKPGPLHQELTKPGGTGRFFFDTFLWTFNEKAKAALHDLPTAEMAGTVMESKKVNIFFDQFLIKEPGTSEATPWHNDVPFWPVRGNQICTLWLALDEVSADSGAVEYVKGSQKWGQWFKPPAFAGDDKYKIDLPKVPDIDAMRDELDLVSFELEPGDCTIHHGLLVHGAPGNSRSDRRRRAYLTRWAGDDATYQPHPNIQKMMWDPDIEAGGPLDSDLWPVIWRARENETA